MSTFVAGNWKTHLLNDSAVALASDVAELCDGSDVAVFPPAVYAQSVHQALTNSQVGLGLQDLSDLGPGATTGDICADQARDIGCQYVLVGHSERRIRQQESSDWVAAKAKAAVDAKLVPLVCVGETLQERESGRHVDAVMQQLLPALQVMQSGDRFMVAYEPVWAIGTGKTASAEDAQAMHAQIRLQLAERGLEQTLVLYGGSVKAANASELAEQPDIDGALVGGAALNGQEFAAIVAAFREKK